MRACRLSYGLLSIGELSGMDRLYRTRKRWGMEKGNAGHGVPPKESERIDSQPARLNGRRRRGSPKGFMRIRHYGLLANRHRTEHVAACRLALDVPTPAHLAKRKPWKPSSFGSSGPIPSAAPSVG